MKKIFIITIAFFILLSSCSRNVDPVVSYGDSYESLCYNGNNYKVFTDTHYFSPFLADPYNISKDRYIIEDNYVADEKDENLCFIYSEGGILRDLVYIKESVSIPDRITSSSEVDYIVVVTSDGFHYSIDSRTDIEVIIDFFNSKEVIDLETSGPLEITSSETINIFVVANCYGGIFTLNRCCIALSENGKYTHRVKDKEIAFPENINNIIIQATSKTQ